MEGFVHEKVYDIDTKEKLIEIIQSKEARENFLEFIFDHHTEFEKWQQFYQERSRIRIIEWLRQHNFHFVFEEDLDLTKNLLEKVKHNLFEAKVSKEMTAARKTLSAKAKTYYSNEALNPRPKRGRPPKQAAKLDLEPQYTVDIFTHVSSAVRPFLFTPDMATSSAWSFSSKFDTEESSLAGRHSQSESDESDKSLKSLNEKLATLRSISNKWVQEEKAVGRKNPEPQSQKDLLEHEKEILKEFEVDFDGEVPERKPKVAKEKKAVAKPKKSASEKKPAVKRIIKPKAEKASLKKVAKPAKRRLKKT